MYLSAERFHEVVEATPLVSIDFVVRDPSGRVLLGYRINRPAQGFWFVPGGRILKNETLDSAFERLTEVEIGARLPRARARPLGVYEHFYQDSFFGEAPGTHYVVLAYALSLDLELDRLPRTQHGRYRWWPIEQAREASDVHENSRVYLAEPEEAP